MVNIIIKSDPRHHFSKDSIRTVIISTLSSQNIKSNAEIEINITSDKRMHELTKAQSIKDEAGEFLTFSIEDLNLQSLQVLPKVGLVISPDHYLKLGSISISYPQALEDAALDGKSVDDEIALIVEQGAKHLLGIHHN